MFKHNKLMVFTAKAAASVIGITIAWQTIAPYYNRILIMAADRLAAPDFRFVADAGSIYYYSSNGEAIMGIHGQALHFGLILLTALLIATPGLKAVNRIRNLSIGLGVLFAVQIATLTFLSRLAQPTGGISMTAPVVLISTIGLNLFPVLVWAILCLKQLFQGVPEPKHDSRKATICSNGFTEQNS